MINKRFFILLLPLLIAATSVTTPNPWTTVPAFPAVCYTAGDPFPDRLEAAMAANQDAIGRQEQINHGLNDQLKAVDPSTKQSRMMAYMQQNPAGFQAYIQLAAQDPAAVQASKEAYLAKMQAFQREFDALRAGYAAATKATLDPVYAEMGRVLDPSSGASNAERAAAVARYNSTYKTLCEKWIIREDFPAFLKKFRAYMTTYLPSLDNETAVEKTTLEMAGISTRDYQPTVRLQAVARYMEYARTVYALRQREAQGL